MTAIPIIVGMSSSIIFLLLLVKLIQRSQGHAAGEGTAEALWSDEWFEEFSSFRYLPMRRLLSRAEEDYYVREQGGGPNARLAFRAERREIFRQHLDQLAADFGRLSMGVRLAVLNATEDRSAELEQLVRLEWSMRRLLWRARARASFHWLAIEPVDTTRLIDALQSLEFSLREARLGAAA